jgi:hypothetical protein
MDPLAQLKDIHLPNQIANYPLAPGWWIVAVLLLTLAIWLLLKGLKSYRLNKVKRQALSILAKINENEENQNDNIMNLLKWSALQYFPRHLVAPLFGQQLQQFMIRCLPIKDQQAFTDLSQSAFDCRYTINELTIQDKTLKQAAQLWLKKALPPKKTTEHNSQAPSENLVTTSIQQAYMKLQLSNGQLIKDQDSGTENSNTQQSDTQDSGTQESDNKSNTGHQKSSTSEASK